MHGVNKKSPQTLKTGAHGGRLCLCFFFLCFRVPAFLCRRVCLNNPRLVFASPLAVPCSSLTGDKGSEASAGTRYLLPADRVCAVLLS